MHSTFNDHIFFERYTDVEKCLNSQFLSIIRNTEHDNIKLYDDSFIKRWFIRILKSFVVKDLIRTFDDVDYSNFSLRFYSASNTRSRIESMIPHGKDVWRIEQDNTYGVYENFKYILYRALSKATLLMMTSCYLITVRNDINDTCIYVTQNYYPSTTSSKNWKDIINYLDERNAALNIDELLLTEVCYRYNIKLDLFLAVNGGCVEFAL